MASDSASISQAKKVLRKQIKSRLSQISSVEVERQSREVTAEVLKLPEFRNASRISVYLSMPRGEISTDGIVKEALGHGKKVFVPCVQKTSGLTRSESFMEMFALHPREDVDSLQRDAWGIPTLSNESLVSRENAFGGLGSSVADEYRSEAFLEGLDLILMPGMAFDLSNGRLGHGRGFYDRFLEQYWELASRKDVRTRMPRLVALALKQQLLSPEGSVPMDTNDWKVDQVITAP